MIYPRRQRRPGTTLILFAMLAFALLGLAALVIDLGFVRVARRQMQSAADTAALEGLRWRDQLPPDAIAGDDMDTARRREASNVVSLLFADANGYQYGAGPVFTLSGGQTSLHAMQTISEPPSLYKPHLQLNTANAMNGDLVAGTYGPNPGYPASAIADETSDYQRRDFVSATGGNSFLARLRRSNDLQSLDNEAGISSSGPALPYLFGRGTMMTAGTTTTKPPRTYDPRSEGVTVRATAIAEARSAFSVGQPDSANTIPGVTPFAMSLTSWNALVAGTPPTTVTVGDPNTLAIPAFRLTIIGQAVPPGGTLRAADLTVATFIPVFATPSDAATLTANRIVGFGLATIAPGAGPNQFQVTKQVAKIAPRNASAGLLVGWDADPSANPDQLDVVIPLAGSVDNALQAPALVR